MRIAGSVQPGRAVRLCGGLAEAGSFAKAAEALGREASVLSRRLSQVEQRLGVRLRSRTTPRASDAGRRDLLPACPVAAGGADVRFWPKAE
ncbi:LysR family transcriptional regulator [Methylobacterium sp. E-065]|uniref:helix-turn-helix domain-containing protein n=1 Tax=Methylobacterium sp. E-065 TaxID=2836583 RepID=UPI0028BDB722|nr:LysR family transcriptional regulator [Methylobacterium sp. E-065]